MGGTVMVDGTTRKVNPGKVLINGTAHNIKQGKTMIDGTVHDILFKEPHTMAPGDYYAFFGDKESCNFHIITIQDTGYYQLVMTAGGNNGGISSGSDPVVYVSGICGSCVVAKIKLTKGQEVTVLVANNQGSTAGVTEVDANPTAFWTANIRKSLDKTSDDINGWKPHPTYANVISQTKPWIVSSRGDYYAKDYPFIFKNIYTWGYCEEILCGGYYSKGTTGYGFQWDKYTNMKTNDFPTLISYTQYDNKSDTICSYAPVSLKLQSRHYVRQPAGPGDPGEDKWISYWYGGATYVEYVRGGSMTIYGSGASFLSLQLLEYI